MFKLKGCNVELLSVKPKFTHKVTMSEYNFARENVGAVYNKRTFVSACDNYQMVIRSRREVNRTSYIKQYKITHNSGQGYVINVSSNDSLRLRSETFKMAFENLFNTVRTNRPNPLRANETDVRSFVNSLGASLRLPDNMRYHSIQTYGNRMVGYVNAKPNQYYDMFQLKRSQMIFESKKPLTTENHLGVEIEFFIPLKQNELALLLMPYAKYVTLKTDGSINNVPNGHYSHEITICVPESIKDNIIDGVCQVLAENGAKVNKSCGLHVHLDSRTRNRDLLFSNLVSAQNIIYSMQPKSRQDNTYCKRTAYKSYSKARSTHDRYRGINAQAYGKFNTIEVRVHSGTVDSTKILNFIDILLCIANKTSEVKRAPSSVKSFAKQYTVPLRLVEYIVERTNKFADAQVQAEEGVA